MSIIFLQQILNSKRLLIIIGGKKSYLKVRLGSAYFTETENFLLKVL